MGNLGCGQKQQIPNINSITLKNSFNIVFRYYASFQGANSNQYFFETSKDDFQLFGFQQFLLNNQPKMIKKYNRKEGEMLLLNKSNEFFLHFSTQTIEFWEFDNYHNQKYCQTIYKDIEFDIETFDEHQNIIDIGINQNEDMLVFQKFQEIYFYNRNEEGFWKIQQTIGNTKYARMNLIKFNESNNIIVAFQTNFFVSFRERKDYLTIFHKNFNRIWQITHHIEQNFDLFCFINDHQFQLFQRNTNISLIYEISKVDFKVKKKYELICEYQIEERYCLSFPAEVQSKKLFFLQVKTVEFAIKPSNKYHVYQVHKIQRAFIFQNILAPEIF